MPEFYSRTMADVVDVDAEAGTVHLLVVPYDRETPIAEMQPGRGLVRYTEVMRKGACERAIRGGAGRLPLTYGHSDSFPDRLGVASKLWDESDGLHAIARLDRSKIDAARDALESSHTGVSVSFISKVPAPFTEREGSLVERRSIHLRHVAAVPDPAYPDARVLAVRNMAENGEDSETDAERAAREEFEARRAALDAALALVEAGKRWEAFR